MKLKKLWPYYKIYNIQRLSSTDQKDLNMIDDTNKDSMLGMIRVLSDIFTTKEFFESDSWELFNKKLIKLKLSDNPALAEMFSAIYSHLKRLGREAYQIHEDFIAVIGANFQSFVLSKQTNLLRNRLFGDE